MEKGPGPKVSSDRLVKLGIEPVNPGLQGKWLIHYTTADPYAIAHAQKQIVLPIRLCHTCVALKHKKTDFSLQTSLEINFEFIKFVKICKLSPFDENK